MVSVSSPTLPGRPWPPALIAATTQLLATVIVAAIAVPNTTYLHWQPTLIGWAFAAGGLAALLGWRLGLASWWLPIQLLFLPLAWWALRWQLPPWLYLLALLLAVLIQRNSLRERVPLYLSSHKVWDEVGWLLEQKNARHCIDLGCGLGGGLRRLARRQPGRRFHGVENSPLAWLTARLLNARINNCHIHYGDLRAKELGHYDVVYAFLSPAPMTWLWHKARREMRPGSLLISNSFAVPGVRPDRTITVADRRGSQLLV